MTTSEEAVALKKWIIKAGKAMFVIKMTFQIIMLETIMLETVEFGGELNGYG